ncbi:tRNA dimethylallyltransferase [Physcia stellaris]|nr:tRNA dimethylallyltransferase [Physcia stellaris]
MYKGLPIATNKISLEERKSIPHHLLDSIRLDDGPWTVSQFLHRANNIIDEIRLKGRLPILVGGTHYYTQSLLFEDFLLEDDSSHMPAEEMEVKWPILAASSEDMLEELKRVDPVMAKTWHPNDNRKIRRSLEIWLTKGQKPSEVYEEQKEKQKQHSVADIARRGNDGISQDGGCMAEDQDSVVDRPNVLQYDPLILWTHASPATLQSRLNRRIQTMLDQGLLSEVEAMYQSLQSQESAGKGVDQSRGIWVAIGYKEFIPYLLAIQNGEPTQKQLEKMKQEAIEKTQIRTRQYARNQIRWIRTQLLPALSDNGAAKRLFCWMDRIFRSGQPTLRRLRIASHQHSCSALSCPIHERSVQRQAICFR